MPLISDTNNIPIRPPNVPDPTAMSGELYFVMLVVMGVIVVCLILFWIIIKIWGEPILKFKSARGQALIEHFENSKIGTLLIAGIGGGALRHKNVADGTLITIPKGINSLEGTSFVLSWHLTGMSVPVFLIGAINKLRQLKIFTRKELEDKITGDIENKIVPTDPQLKFKNLIDDSYNFNSFEDILYKSNNPSLIPLEIEHISDFIESINQHYTESIIEKEKRSAFMQEYDPFESVLMATAIASLIVAIGVYFMIGSVK